eukprot:scaffold2804_cov196-Pinguiococcus_pyrenoidosus.AAC.1
MKTRGFSEQYEQYLGKRNRKITKGLHSTDSPSNCTVHRNSINRTSPAASAWPTGTGLRDLGTFFWILGF